MARVLDEDTARTLASGRQTVWSMLSSAQTNLKKVFLVFVTGMMLTIISLYTFLWDKLKRDLVDSRMDVETAAETEIIAVTPFDVILLQFKVGLVVGIVVSLPVLVYVSKSGLKERGYWPSSEIPRWKVYGFVLSVFALFLVGISYAYFLFFPIMFEFLAANAVQAGFKPTWSIVKWTEFMMFLALSFGVAAQLPLFMSFTARTGIIPYETYRDKWRYAVVAIFVFGAMFSPPDPFTQIMWGVPLVLLYAISLAVTKLAVLSKQVGQQVSATEVARDRWNVLLGSIVVTAAGVYVYILEGGIEATNDLLIWVNSSYRVILDPDDLAVFGLSTDVAAGLVGVLVGIPVAGIVLFYFRIKVLERVSQEVDQTQETSPSKTAPTAEAGESANIDIEAMSAQALKGANVEAFTQLGQDEALQYAQQAIDADNPEKGKIILDRFDEAQEYLEQQEAEDEDEPDEDEEESFVASRAAGMVDPFTDDETTEDDIGGYYYDIRFILDSLTSKAIWIVGTFMVVMAGSFMWLYTGGIGDTREVFFSRMPSQAVGEPNIVVLHPVESLVFMLKFSTLLGAVSIVPILLYFAWPAVRTRGISDGNRNVILVWGGTLFLTLLGGTFLGFLYIAPSILSFLAWDVIDSNMIIAYRISSFGWLVIYLTVGVGIMTMIPVTMVLFHYGNIVRYRQMRRGWRGVVLAFFAVAGFASPSGIGTMFLVALPASFMYGIGLGILWFYTRITRSVPRRTGEAAD